VIGGTVPSTTPEHDHKSDHNEGLQPDASEEERRKVRDSAHHPGEVLAEEPSCETERQTGSVAEKCRSPVACNYGRIRDVLIRSRRRSEAELAERLGAIPGVPRSELAAGWCRSS
jgi:hypothetical protein